MAYGSLRIYTITSILGVRKKKNCVALTIMIKGCHCAASVAEIFLYGKKNPPRFLSEGVAQLTKGL